MDRARFHAALLVSLTVIMAGCEHAVVGNAMALGMTCCLFFGTLQLGRRPGKPGEPKRPAGASTAPK